MTEYSREQRNQLSRAVANSDTGSRQLKGVVDNRNTIIHRTPQVLQQKQVDNRSVGKDMFTSLDECFTETTKNDLRNKKDKLINPFKYPTVKCSPCISAYAYNIRGKGADIAVDYKNLAEMNLPEKSKLLGWLREPKNEHMWINHGGTIKVASRNNEKKPHPTLAGGDPDVSCAGLMYIDSTSKQVVVNNNSGHFKPGNVDQDSIDAIETALDGAEGYSIATMNRRKR